MTGPGGSRNSPTISTGSAEIKDASYEIEAAYISSDKNTTGVTVQAAPVFVCIAQSHFQYTDIRKKPARMLRTGLDDDGLFCVVSSALACDQAEDCEVRNCVSAKTVGAMHAAGDLTCRKQTRNRFAFC